VVLNIVGLVCVDISLARFVDLGSGSYFVYYQLRLC